MGSRIQAAAGEIVRQGAQFDRWGTLALMDISLRYRRTVIGPLWITLTLAATIASVGTVYATLFKQNVAVFLPSFAVGLIVWTLIAATLQEGSNVFVASGHLIKAVPAPLIVHVLQMTARNIVIFLHHLLLVVLLYVVMPWPLHWTLMLAVPGFAIQLVTLVGGAIVLGLLCARFRDIGSAIVSGLQFVFFLTPIIWTEDAVRGTAFHWLTRVNPFATLLDLVRKPLLAQPADPEQWLLGSLYAVGMAMIGLGCYAGYRHRVAYWLRHGLGCPHRAAQCLGRVSGAVVSRPLAAQPVRARGDAAECRQRAAPAPCLRTERRRSRDPRRRPARHHRRQWRR